MNKTAFLFLGVGLTLGVVFSVVYPHLQPYEVRREGIISEMNALIGEEVEDGTYRCCIEPACDMCFLGHWMWDDGVCRCDEYIAKGEFDKVCPQCQRGLEEGRCRSSENICPILPDGYEGEDE